MPKSPTHPSSFSPAAARTSPSGSLRPSSSLRADWALDSLDALEVVLCIESCFRIKIPDENIAILRSINTVVDYVLEQQYKAGGRA